MRGRLEEFNLGDILQLYQISGRTGSVRVWTADSEVHTIFVDRGRVSGAGADNWNLIDAIRRIEWLPDDVSAQLDVIEREGSLTGLSLIARALLSAHAWEYFSERQLEELVFPALTWQSGEFDATVDQIPRVSPFRINQSPQQLVLSAARWEEEVKSAESAGFGPASCWVRTGDPPDGLEPTAEEPPQVVMLLDRPRSVAEVAAAAGLSILRVIDQVRQLRQLELVRRLD